MVGRSSVTPSASACRSASSARPMIRARTPSLREEPQGDTQPRCPGSPSRRTPSSRAARLRPLPPGTRSPWMWASVLLLCGTVAGTVAQATPTSAPTAEVPLCISQPYACSTDVHACEGVVVIPDHVTVIPDNAFKYCSLLTAIIGLREDPELPCRPLSLSSCCCSAFRSPARRVGHGGAAVRVLWVRADLQQRTRMLRLPPPHPLPPHPLPQLSTAHAPSAPAAGAPRCATPLSARPSRRSARAPSRTPPCCASRSRRCRCPS